MITVTTQGFGDTTIDGQTLDLIPTMDAAGTNATVNDGGKAIYAWKCGSGASTTVDKKYLPGSCK